MYRSIKELRESRGLSLKSLSDVTGISKSTLQRYETGTTKKIPVEAIKKLEAVFGASLETHELTAEDKQDISVMLQNVLGQLCKKDASVMFGGETLDDKSRKLLIDSLKNSMEMAKLISKKRER